MAGLRVMLYALLGVLMAAGLITLVATSLATDEPPRSVILGAFGGVVLMLAAVIVLELDGRRAASRAGRDPANESARTSTRAKRL